MGRATLTAASVILDTFLSCPIGAMKLIALRKVIFLAGPELIPCSEATQQVEFAPVYPPKQLEHNHKKPITFQPMTTQNKHFSNIADKYRDLRTTDLEPVLCIKKGLEKLPRIEAANVGCGAGRYDLQLFKHIGDRLYLNCLDANGEMLNQLEEYLSGQGINNFRTKRSSAETLPLESNSLDCMFTFNAVHHFNLTSFLREALRVLKGEGYLFIYTRLRSQNSRNIWGTYFPLFNEKETRLYELNEIQEMVGTVQAMKLDAAEYFKYERKSPISRLIEQADNRHYSTFDLYAEKEFSKSLEQFKRILNRQFEDLQNIEWFDENILLVLRKS